METAVCCCKRLAGTLVPWAVCVVGFVLLGTQSLRANPTADTPSPAMRSLASESVQAMRDATEAAASAGVDTEQFQTRISKIQQDIDNAKDDQALAQSSREAMSLVATISKQTRLKCKSTTKPAKESHNDAPSSLQDLLKPGNLAFLISLVSLAISTVGLVAARSSTRRALRAAGLL